MKSVAKLLISNLIKRFHYLLIGDIRHNLKAKKYYVTTVNNHFALFHSQIKTASNFDVEDFLPIWYVCLCNRCAIHVINSHLLLNRPTRIIPTLDCVKPLIALTDVSGFIIWGLMPHDRSPKLLQTNNYSRWSF